MTAKLSPVIAMRCPRCGHSWNLPRRADGTYPQTAACAKLRGGCGHVVKVPRQARAGRRAARAPAAADDSAGPAVWEPPSEPRGVRPAGEPCPHCGEPMVYPEPRGTIRVCLSCGKRVTPPAVLAPYERGAGVTRAAKSQRERDLEALGLAGRKGLMLGQLRALADDDRLDPASVLKVEWFAEQVKAAASAARLDELAALFGEAGIRRRRWWQQPPAALTAGYADDDDGQADEPAAVPAAPASAAGQQQRAMTWADAIAASGWRITPTVGGCQIVDERAGHCAADTSSPAIPDGRGGHAWLCNRHYGTLARVIGDHNRRIA
jgi:hypothetical protein